MTREEVKDLLPILQAFAEGRVIQYRDNGVWKDITTEEGFYTENAFVNVNDYRIKPELTYRPFANAEECWQEMLKHQPFGYVKDKEDGHYTLITSVDEHEGISFGVAKNWRFNDVMKFYNFADGSVFGIKESED